MSSQPVIVSDPSKTRVSLILRINNSQDVAAWQEFTEIYHPIIYRTVRRKGLQEADAADLAQEVLTRVAKAIDSWNPDPAVGTFRGWLATITRNLVVEFFRKQKRLPITTSHTDIQQLLSQRIANSDSAVFDSEHEQTVFKWASQKVRAKFDERSWKAFWETAVTHRPVKEVAQELRMTAGAIYIARCRVLKSLRETVRQYQSEEIME